jgi:UDP-N-acetylglucosamine acyltransferase
MSDIHPTALVDSQARIGRNVRIGPFAVIEAGASVGDDCVLMERVHVGTGTTLGRSNLLYPGAVVGHDPQHRQGEPGGLLAIGDRNVFREYVTLHRGMKKGSATRIGNDNYFMAFAHAGHDAAVGNGVTVANTALLGGHAAVEDGAFLSACVLVHQFARIGRLAMVGGAARVTRDVPPYLLVADGEDRVASVNLVGLKRAGFSAKATDDVKRAYRLFYFSGLGREEALEEIGRTLAAPEIRHFTDFIRSSKRGTMPHRKARAPEDALEPGAPDS